MNPFGAGDGNSLKYAAYSLPAKAKVKKAVKEADVEGHLKKRARSRKAQERKVVWQGRTGAPDRAVLFGTAGASLRLKEIFRIVAKHGDLAFDLDDCDALVRELVGKVIALVELKRPDVKTPRVRQCREHDELRKMGLRVEVINTVEGVDALLP